MLVWIGFAILAAAVTWAVTRPLLAHANAKASAPDSELAVYRDQLAEIETERADGLIAGSEAEAARIEVARRLIRTAEEHARLDAAPSAREASRLHQAAVYAAAAIPVAAIALYLVVGSPSLPGRPYASRISEPVEQASAADLVAKVEAHLRQSPDDGRGWDVLAPVYMRMGEFQQAEDAYERAIRLLGESPARLAGFARAAIMPRTASSTSPRARPTRSCSAPMRRRSSRRCGWRSPRSRTAISRARPPNTGGSWRCEQTKDPWRQLLDERLKVATAKLNGEPEPQAAAPDAGDVGAMSPEARQKFIDSMVAGLADRLKKDGKDLAGWMQLVRAYTVLGKKQEATTALSDARASFAGDEKSLAQLHELAQSLGLGS